MKKHTKRNTKKTCTNPIAQALAVAVLAKQKTKKVA